jgi:hypothetical protein
MPTPPPRREPTWDEDTGASCDTRDTSKSRKSHPSSWSRSNVRLLIAPTTPTPTHHDDSAIRRRSAVNDGHHRPRAARRAPPPHPTTTWSLYESPRRRTLWQRLVGRGPAGRCPHHQHGHHALASTWWRWPPASGRDAPAHRVAASVRIPPRRWPPARAQPAARRSPARPFVRQPPPPPPPRRTRRMAHPNERLLGRRRGPRATGYGYGSWWPRSRVGAAGGRPSRAHHGSTPFAQ